LYGEVINKTYRGNDEKGSIPSLEHQHESSRKVMERHIGGEFELNMKRFVFKNTFQLLLNECQDKLPLTVYQAIVFVETILVFSRYVKI
jgi:hypothetical protein